MVVGAQVNGMVCGGGMVEQRFRVFYTVSWQSSESSVVYGRPRWSLDVYGSVWCNVVPVSSIIDIWYILVPGTRY